MKANESKLDRIIRAVLGAILLGVGILVVKGTIGIVLDVLGGILLFTAATGVCLLYLPFKFSTLKK
jgi:uncharacterized membrane protein